MHAFAAKPAIPTDRARSSGDLDLNRGRQRAADEVAMPRMTSLDPEAPIGASTGRASSRASHDFSRIAIRPAIDGRKRDDRGDKTPAPAHPAAKPDEKREAPSLTADAKPAAPKKPTITHETTFAAPDGSAKTRTDVAVGETVTFRGDAAGEWTATAGDPTKLASGARFVWTAPARAATVTITLKVGAADETVAMKVIEPDSITGRKNSEIAIGAGTAGAGMKLTFLYHPDRVSFGNVQAKEVSGPATNITGYFKKRYTADQLRHDSGDTFTSIKENNEDSAEDTASAELSKTPYETGTFDWVIPNHFKVKTETGDGKKFTAVTQAFEMLDATGKVRITKAVTAKVERSP